MTADQLNAVIAVVKDLTLSSFAIIALYTVYRDGRAERTMWISLITTLFQSQSEQLKLIEQNRVTIEELKGMIDDRDAAMLSRPPSPTATPKRAA